MNEVGPNHLQCEAGRDKAEDSNGGDRELPIVGIEIAPVVATDRRTPTDLTKWLWLLLYNPTPPASPFIPLHLLETLRVCALSKRPRNPSNRDSNGIPLLDLRDEIVAKERYARVGEKGHARHRFRREVQEMESVGVHDVVEEI